MFSLEIAVFEFFILLKVSFLGSLLTASAGLGGGSLLIAVMASILPAPALIPIHGAVLMGSNGFRFVLTRQHANYGSLLPFALGGFIAFIFGMLSLLKFNFNYTPALVGLFILFTTWFRIPKLNLLHSKIGMLLGGLVTSFLTFFVGATGPLVAAWIGVENKSKLSFTADLSACMTFQHTIKLLLFMVTGFVFFEWISLIIAMIGSGYLGAKIGLRWLQKTSTVTFQRVFKVFLTILALRLIWTSYA